MKIFILNLLLVILLFTVSPVFSADQTADRFRFSRNTRDLSGDLTPSLLINADFFSMPYCYNQDQDTTYSNFFGSLFVGARIKDISMGAQVDIRYYWFNGYTPAIRQFVGAFNILRGTYQIMYQPYDWFEMYWGIGGAWLATAYELNYQGFIQSNLPGFSVVSGAHFYVWKYITLSIPLSLDLFFTSRKYYPYFYGGARVSFHPYFKWISISLELGGMVWKYDDVYLDILTGLLVWKAGISISLDFTETQHELRELKNKIREKKGLTDEDVTRKQLWKLRYAHKGQSLSFDQILFDPDKSTLKKESHQILDRIAEVLLQRKKIYIEIGGYTNYTGYPEKEMHLSIERAATVTSYLHKKGLLYEQMKIAGYGSGAYSKRDRGIEESKRRVVITILEVFKN